MVGNCKRKFSILGDSLSTLEGFSEPRDAFYYSYGKGCETGVVTVADTWWGMVIDRLDGELLVNNSFYGSMVHKHRGCDIPSYACSDERTSALGREGAKPDVIMISVGTNDWGCGVLPKPREWGLSDSSVFSVAYDEMLRKLKNNYPMAEIWCITPFAGICRNNPEFVFPYLYAGRHIEEYCNVISECAEQHGCRLIDLYRCPHAIDTVDGFHPNREGMSIIADFVIERAR